MSTDPKEFDLDPALEAELEALFAEARDMAPDPSDALLARIEADAAALQPLPARRVSATMPASAPTGGGWFGFDLGLGGWSSLGGLTAALVVGFGIGLSPPDAVSSLTSDLLGSDASALEDVFWSFDSSLLEG